MAEKRHAHNWKGGRVVEPRGYVLIYVGKGHPLADVRGYAYEHRLIAQAVTDRPLTSSDEVHHEDEDKGNNAPGNLSVKMSKAEHRFAHRKNRDSGRRLPGEPNAVVACACGCGETFPRFDECGRPRTFVSGHNQQNSGFPGDLLWYLENVPEPSTTQFLASFFAVNERKVTAAMSKLKLRGSVRKCAGEWRLCHG